MNTPALQFCILCAAAVPGTIWFAKKQPESLGPYIVYCAIIIILGAFYLFG